MVTTKPPQLLAPGMVMGVERSTVVGMESATVVDIRLTIICKKRFGLGQQTKTQHTHPTYFPTATPSAGNVHRELHDRDAIGDASQSHLAEAVR